MIWGIVGSIFLIVGILASIAIFLVRNIFGNMFKKAEKVVGVEDVGGTIFDYFLSSVYLNIFLFLFLPGIVFLLIAYFY